MITTVLHYAYVVKKVKLVIKYEISMHLFYKNNQLSTKKIKFIDLLWRKVICLRHNQSIDYFYQMVNDTSNNLNFDNINIK